MALIECNECNGKVSETAPTCPHCGHQLIVEKEPLIKLPNSKLPKWGFVNVLIFGLFSVFLVKLLISFGWHIGSSGKLILVSYSLASFPALYLKETSSKINKILSWIIYLLFLILFFGLATNPS